MFLKHCVGIIAISLFVFSAGANDLDDFMSKVLAKRKIDSESLRDYIFNEKETLEIKGEKTAALESFRREYTWFVRDGYLVRSPLSINGVKVSPEEQKTAEEGWIESQKKGKHGSGLEREAFLGFPFEKGRYLYVGEQQFEGRKVVAIEYYPTITTDPKSKSEKKLEKKYNLIQSLEKSLLVTMLIVPEEHQIVKLTFNNVGLEFLPARWLLRINDIKASMIMDKPLNDVWLPINISAHGSLSTAAFNLTAHYSREFYSYQKTDVKVRFWPHMDDTQPKP